MVFEPLGHLRKVAGMHRNIRRSARNPIPEFVHKPDLFGWVHLVERFVNHRTCHGASCQNHTVRVGVAHPFILMARRLLTERSLLPIWLVRLVAGDFRGGGEAA